MVTIKSQTASAIAGGITLTGQGLQGLLLGHAQSTVSLSPFANMASMGTINLDSFTVWDNPNVKKYEIIETTEDLMALSTAWYRIRMARTPEDGGTVFPTTLVDAVLFPEVNNDDRQQAAAIRDYYSKKIMMWKLKGKELTNFQKDMNEFIHTDGLKFQEKMLPLVYSLPGFYAYDQDFDVMMSNHDTVIKQDEYHIVTTRKLTLAKVLSSGKRSAKKKEYWFSDESSHLVKMTFQADNPLLSLLDNYAQDPIYVYGLYTKLTKDDKDYFLLSKHKFI